MIELCIQQATNRMDLIDTIAKISTILIALFNLVFAFIIYRTNKRKQEIDKTQKQKINWFKTLILDHNLPIIYNFFDELLHLCTKLQRDNNSLEDKKVINEEVLDKFKCLRKKSIDLFNAADGKLCSELIEILDGLQDQITNSIFEEGIKLSHLPKYEEVIEDEIYKTKTDLLNRIFKYNGE